MRLAKGIDNIKTERLLEAYKITWKLEQEPEGTVRCLLLQNLFPWMSSFTPAVNAFDLDSELRFCVKDFVKMLHANGITPVEFTEEDELDD